MPAKDSVTIRMTAEDAGAFDEWRKQAKGPEMMGDAIEKAANKGKAGVDQLGSGLTNLVGKWASVAAMMEVVKRAFTDFINTRRELEQSQAKASADADAALRKYFVTAKLGDEKQQAASTQRIGNIALQQKSTLPAAGAAADLLTKFGATRDAAEGESLEELLKLQNATSASGGDPEEFSRRVLEIIRRTTPGGKVNAKSIAAVGATMRKLTSSDLGFGDQAFDAFAKYGTMLHDGGYDTSTGMALTAAVTEKYDPRQARAVLKEISKPGMQKGEAALLARARGALGTDDGQAEYNQAAEIGRGSVAALQAESETGGTLAQMGQKKLTRDQILDRLKASARAHGADDEEIEDLTFRYKHPASQYLSFGFYDESDEQRALHAVGVSAAPDWMLTKDELSRRGRQREIYEQSVGHQAISTTIRIKGQDGRDVPHSVEAAGIQSR